MDWSAVEAPLERRLLAQTFVGVIPRFGVNRRALAAASIEAFGDPDRWRSLFAKGPTEAIWFVSEVSDASMRAAFASASAADMSSVIQTRFDQNVELKPFVRQVMRYDVLRPLQALSRMQRTARAMFGCTAAPGRPSFFRLAALNVVYTALVFVWLHDRTAADQRTRKATRSAMRALGV